MKPLVILAIVAGCSQQAEPPPKPEKPPAIPAAEVQRGLDACHGYVAKVCVCAGPAAQEACILAKSMPEAIESGRRVTAYPDSSREDALQAAGSIRKTVKQCIEKTAQLSSLGCS